MPDTNTTNTTHTTQTTQTTNAETTGATANETTTRQYRPLHTGTETCTIYTIKCMTDSSFCYVGSTAVSIDERVNKHIYSCNEAPHRKIYRYMLDRCEEKYGERRMNRERFDELFVTHVIHTTTCDYNTRVSVEQQTIALMATAGMTLYNTRAARSANFEANRAKTAQILAKPDRPCETCGRYIKVVSWSKHIVSAGHTAAVAAARLAAADAAN